MTGVAKNGGGQLTGGHMPGYQLKPPNECKLTMLSEIRYEYVSEINAIKLLLNDIIILTTFKKM